MKLRDLLLTIGIGLAFFCVGAGLSGCLHRPALTPTLSQGEREMSGADAPASGLESTALIPWVEVIRGKEFAVRDGIAAWGSHGGQRVVLTTVWGRGSVLLAIQPPWQDTEMGSGVRAVPGIKASSKLRSLDDVDGWAAIAAQVGPFVMTCPPADDETVAVFVLESETVIQPYLTSAATVDWPQFARAVRQLPAEVECKDSRGVKRTVEVEYWTAGTSTSASAVHKTFFKRYVHALSRSLPRLKIIDATWGVRARWSSRHSRASRESAQAFVGRNGMIPLLYVGTDRAYWTPAEIGQAVRQAGSPPIVLMHLGLSRWPTLAEEIGVEYERLKGKR